MHCNRWNGDAQRAGCWCRCWSTAKCHCVRDGKCGAAARRAVCARRMQFQKRLRFPQRVQPATATACLGRVMQCPTGSRKPPGATPPGGTREGGSQRGQTRGQRRTRETPAKTRGLRLFPIGYLHNPQTEPPCLLYTAGCTASAGERK